jgi:hypothetical protein
MKAIRWRRRPRTSPQTRTDFAALVDRLAVPHPFQLEEFCAGIARRRGRPLHLVPLENAAGADLPCGLWVGLDTADLVFYEAGAAPILKAQIVLHEISHMLLNHLAPEGTAPADGAELAGRAGRAERTAKEATERAADLELGLAPDRLRALLARNGYSSRQESDAESLATLILERATRAAGAPDPASPHAGSPRSAEVLARLNDAFGNSARNT